MSLPYQRQIIDEYAIREGLHIDVYFGGKYESAKIDGRQEFQCVLDYIKRARRLFLKSLYILLTDSAEQTEGQLNSDWIIPRELLLSIALFRFIQFVKCKRFVGLIFKCKLVTGF